MSEKTLEVWCFDEHAGTIRDAPDGLQFVYAKKWLDGGRPPLSQSLPLDGSFSDAASQAFFGGLLPEGAPRDLLARRRGVSADNDFALLAAQAGDTAGAVSLRVPGEPPVQDPHDVEWLDDTTLLTLIDELPSRPMHADPDGEYRLSLAGVQDKLPVVVDEASRRIGLTKGQTPSTHILKTPIERLDDTVINEALCPLIGIALGIETVSAQAHSIDDRDFLLVRRYDRFFEGDRWHRLHQEDFCQALAIPARRKYENEGGPSLADCFALLRRASDVPAHEVLRFLDAVALNFLVGNNDAHGKNYSLLYRAGAQGATLAPTYDVVSTVAYNRTHDLSRRMAMRIGGEYRPEYLRPRHLDSLIEEAGLGAAPTRRRLYELARSAPAAARSASLALAAEGWERPVLSRVVSVVEERARILSTLAAPQPPTTSRRTAAK
jgi:serine/threonine-protein kinase HipA